MTDSRRTQDLTKAQVLQYFYLNLNFIFLTNSKELQKKKKKKKNEGPMFNKMFVGFF